MQPHPEILKITCLLAVLHCSLGTLVIGPATPFGHPRRSNLVNDVLKAVGVRQVQVTSPIVLQRTSFTTTSSSGRRGIMSGSAASHCPSRKNTFLS